MLIARQWVFSEKRTSPQRKCGEVALHGAQAGGLRDSPQEAFFVVGNDGALTTDGRRQGVMLNKDLFQILKFKRFKLGNQVYPTQGPTTLTDTMKEIYWRVPTKWTYTQTTGDWRSLGEGSLPTRHRIYLLTFNDRPNGTLSPPAVLQNINTVHTVQVGN